MTVETLRSFFLWCFIFDLGLLLIWYLFIVFAHDFVYRMHTKFFRITPEAFDVIHYSGMAILKGVLLVFNLVPYLALLMVG